MTTHEIVTRENDENYIDVTLEDFIISINDVIEEIYCHMENDEVDVDMIKETCEDELKRFEIRANELLDTWERHGKYPKNVIEATSRLAEYVINGLKDDIREA